jgi:hypothetical protein
MSSSSVGRARIKKNEVPEERLGAKLHTILYAGSVQKLIQLLVEKVEVF